MTTELTRGLPATTITASPEKMALVARLSSRSATVAILGQGYVGLPLAIEFAGVGFRVVGVDVDASRVTALGVGSSHSPDVSDATLQRVLESGHYRVTNDLDALHTADAVVICVPTPLRKSKDPDISFLLTAGESVASRLAPGRLIVLESTTYPGTTEELLLPMLSRNGLQVGRDFYLAFSPERLDPGNPRHRLHDTTKLIGGVTPACTVVATLLYSHVVRRVFEVSGPRVAELAKLHENTFRAVNIAMVNELAVICRHLGVDVWEVIEAASTKEFGFMPFQPGPGIGGHCIPVDPLYLSWKVRLRGYEAKFIGLADEVNSGMQRVVVDLVADALNGRRQPLQGSRILVLGVAYKAGMGDVRDSPAIGIIDALRAKGAEVRYTDPFVPRARVAGGELDGVKLDADALRGADMALILTDHAEFDYRMVLQEAPLVVDTRNATRGLAAEPGRVVRL
jgi:UDP-N-acetyl-D-glucosamine dehydrogenase